jgi:hypothetical protein
MDTVAPTYDEPLSGLQVSWGAILAGTLASIAGSLIIWALAFAIIVSAVRVSVTSLSAGLVAAGICGIFTTWVGSFVGGAVAGYVPGNPRRVLAGLHGVLSWALAFVVVSWVQYSCLTAFTSLATDAVVSTTGAIAQGAGSAIGGAAAAPGPLDVRAVSVLVSFGYPPVQAQAMVQGYRAELQRLVRGPRIGPPGAMRNALDTIKLWAAGLTWAWFGTWLGALVLALLGSALGARRLEFRPVPARRQLREAYPERVPYTASPHPA